METTSLIMENHGIVFLNFCGNGGKTVDWKVKNQTKQTNDYHCQSHCAPEEI